MMKETYVIELSPGGEVTEFFLVKRSEIKTGSNGKQYYDVLLADRTGEIAAKKWDVESAETDLLLRIKPGDIVKVKAQVTEWNGQPQLRLARIRQQRDTDEILMTEFIKAAPELPEEMFAFIRGKAEGFRDEALRKACLLLLDENRERLLYYPAAKTNHHAIFAGLLYHVTRMLRMAERCCEVYTFLNCELLMAGVIVHDIDKLNEMDADATGTVNEYTFEGQMLGHLVMGVRTIDRIADEAGLSREKAVMLEHMMISHHYEAEFGSPKKPVFPEAEALHYMDMLDSKLYDFEDALAGIKPGGFTDWVRTLDGRKLYKSSFNSFGGTLSSQKR
ncbi:MAG: OB-fold nucleic acid binding domain-containing protein [Clostridiales bacterium]|nr:OB-fold nucleic acid binding domain-containing protein [Clostridiales bacterium]